MTTEPTVSLSGPRAATNAPATEAPRHGGATRTLPVMAFTVADVLKLDVVQAAEPEVVAGWPGASARVRWLHISELPDIGSLLKGGEILLTTGLGIGATETEQREYIHGLAAAGVAALAVELGRPWAELPPALIDAADAAGLAVVVLRRESKFVEITERVHSSILSRQHELLLKAERLASEFTRLVLHGAGADEIVKRLATFVRNPVIFEDALHHVLEIDGHGTPPQELLASWEHHARTRHKDWNSPEGEDGACDCVRTPVRVRHELWGWLHMRAVNSGFDAFDQLAMDHATAALGLTLLSEQNALQLSINARGALISGILGARFSSTEEVLERARSLGVDLLTKDLYAVEVDSGIADLTQDRKLSEHERNRLSADVTKAVTDAMTTAGLVGLTGLLGDRVLALVGVGRRASLRSVMTKLHAEAAESLDERFGCRARIGVSAQVGDRSIGRAFDEAAEALKFANRSNAGSMQYYEDLGFHQLLLRLPETDLARYTESELGPILQHDANSNSPLFETLTVYLRHGGNKSSAAKTLCIERRSLYHRLDRITELLGRDIDDPEIRTRLMLAVRSRELLRARST